MRIYVARHGQVATDAQYHDGDYSLPKGEIDLSPLGRQQASLLGGFLKKRGFSGRIYASPLMRTMETAQLTRLVRPDVISIPAILPTKIRWAAMQRSGKLTSPKRPFRQLERPD